MSAIVSYHATNAIAVVVLSKHETSVHVELIMFLPNTVRCSADVSRDPLQIIDYFSNDLYRCQELSSSRLWPSILVQCQSASSPTVSRLPLGQEQTTRNEQPLIVRQHQAVAVILGLRGNATKLGT